MAAAPTTNLDEAAVLIHRSRPARIAVTMAVGLLCLLMAPWTLCAAWSATALALEGWGHLSTRAQHAKRAVGLATRISFAAHYILICLNWLLLCGLLWRLGSLEGQVSAVIMIGSVAALITLLVFQTPLAFLFAGAAPAAAALVVMTIDGGNATAALLPSAVFLLLSMVFFIGRALELPSALAAQRSLDATQAQYRIMADSMSDIIGRRSLDGRLTYLSPSIERLTGFSVAECMEKSMFHVIHPDDHALAREAVSRVVSDGGEGTFEYRFVSKAGETIWMEVRVMLVAFNGPDAPSEILTVSRDISGRKALQFELIAAKEQAEIASQAKSDFLANMSHELRTPLNAVIGFARMLRKAEGLDPSHARYAELIDDGGTTLLAVVNNVLDFSRLGAGAVVLAAAAFDPVDLVRSMAALLSLGAAQKEITLKVGVDGAGGDLIGDAPLIRQLVLNLIGNALKFTEQGEVSVQVSQTDMGAGASTLRVSVTDTGIGMSEAQLARVFERFEQADGSMSRRFGGTGLGLAVCQRLVALMGGRIGAESIEGAGSRFWFELDLPKAPAAGAALALPQLQIPDPAAPAQDPHSDRRLRLLVVDDVAVNRELVCALLSPFDIDISKAADGAEALALASHEAFDLILMDVQMPVMDGLTATRAIRGLDQVRLAQVPIVALTANVLPEQVARCLEAGMNDHLGKPIDTERLLQTIDRLTSPAAQSPGVAAAA